MKKEIKIAYNCRFFRGDIPCEFHKVDGKSCYCEFYKKIDKRILIIKLGAMGDVIRTTPILRKLKEEFPNSEISWLTYYPELLPKTVDIPIKFTLDSVITLLGDSFDILYNFDKEKVACSLANILKAKVKRGFGLKYGRCFPLDKYSEHKFLTGIRDDFSKKNRLSYPEEIFEIAGFKYSKEKYKYEIDLDTTVKEEYKNLKHPVVGLNYGCGERWKTRLWPIENWIELGIRLKKRGFSVLLLGGEKEHEVNLKIQKESGVNYFGFFPLKEFINIVNLCDLIVTPVTLTLHIAIGLQKRIILFNNIFNKYEFELYGCGEIIEPEVDCLGCYKSECAIKCMEKISVEKVFEKILFLLKTNNST